MNSLLLLSIISLWQPGMSPLKAQELVTSDSIPLIVEFSKFSNDTDIKMPDLNEFKLNIINTIQPNKFSFTYQNKTNITIQFSVKLWNDRDHNNLCQIDAELKNYPNSPKPSLQFISAVSPCENFPTYLQNSMNRMCRDLLRLNNIIRIQTNPVIEFNQTSNRSTTSTSDEKAIDLTAPFEFSQVKVDFKPTPPSYPLLAKTQKIRSTVVIIITINPNGVPVASQIVQGHPLLNETALSFSLKWRFEAAKINGIGQWCKFRLNIPFT
jgi:TonB family protein